MSFRGYMLLVAGLAFGGALFSQAQKDNGPAQQKKPVDFKADRSYVDRALNRSLGIDENAMIMVGNVAFHHNGAVISCDSAVRYSDNHIDFFENAILNKDSTFVYGDRVEYNGEENLARVYSPMIKVIDGGATLYTYNLSFNTLDNVGRWFGGGVLYQEDNTMESEKGYFYSDLHEMVAVQDVEMKNDSHSLISDSVRYNTETKVASFYTETYIWTKQDEMISAYKGRYNTRDSTYFFYDRAYILTEFRETWADTIDFNARSEDAVLQGNVQIDDAEHQSSAFGDYGQYWGERGETMLTLLPSLLNYDADQGNSDTLYMRADTIFMFVRYPADNPRSKLSSEEQGEVTDRFEHLRWTDSLPDSVRVAMADSLAPIVARLRRESNTLRQTADSIFSALYPVATDSLPPVARPLGDTLPSLDTVSVFDTVGAGDMADTMADVAPLQEPVEKQEPPEAIDLRLRAGELTTLADSLGAVEGYLRPQPRSGGGGMYATATDSMAAARIDSLASVDSLARADSVLQADPKAYRKHLKTLEKAKKAERHKAKAEAKAARRAEKQRIRDERRAAKTAAREAKIAERRRQATVKRGWVTQTPLADSIARADSMLALDSLVPAIVDSLEATSVPDIPASRPDTVFRIFRGWRNVKIWRPDTQAVCDSMVGFSADSTMHMYIDPVLWHADSQVDSDSIVVFTAGEQIERAEFYGNPIMGMQLGDGSSEQFNQVTGRTMTSWFRDSEIYRHDANENAQSLYYMQEESENEDGEMVYSDPIAFLTASGAAISFVIENQYVDYIRMDRNVDYTVYPIDKIPGSQPTRLAGFEWHADRKPEMADVFDRTVRPSRREAYESMPRPGFAIAARIDKRREYLTAHNMWADRTDPLPAHAVEFRIEKTGQ